MMSLQDALFNWLTIKIVVEVRPDDAAAAETETTFWEMLTDQHGIDSVDVSKDEMMYYLSFEQNGEQKTSRFPREMVEVMLNQITQEPEKFPNYPNE